MIISCKSEDTGDNPVVMLDSDGDGILDEQEVTNVTNKNNACNPQQSSGYTGFDETNTVWLVLLFFARREFS